MNALVRLLLIVVISIPAFAADVRFQGVKPAIIIDVRTPQEFADGHIEGALNIPYDQIDQGIRTVKWLKKESPILLYCRSGKRAEIARSFLEQQGFKQVLNGGGMTTLVQSLKTCTAEAC